MSQVLKKLGALGVIPVVKIHRASDAVPLGEALLAGGLACAEITLRTADAEDVIRQMSTQLPRVLVGAGTVLSVDQARRAVSAGAQFVVSPGLNPKVVTWCIANGITVIPGALTPSEIEEALDMGLDVVKFFPAEAIGGIGTLAAIAAPYQGVMRFIPTGGISENNLATYLAHRSVHCCGGSWFVGADLISASEFDRITQLTRAAVSIVCRVRGASETLA